MLDRYLINPQATNATLQKVHLKPRGKFKTIQGHFDIEDSFIICFAKKYGNIYTCSHNIKPNNFIKQHPCKRNSILGPGPLHIHIF